MASRIYVVKNISEGTANLVEANYASQALRFIAKHIYRVKSATSKEVADFMEAGGKVNKAVEDKETPPQKPDATDPTPTTPAPEVASTEEAV